MFKFKKFDLVKLMVLGCLCSFSFLGGKCFANDGFCEVVCSDAATLLGASPVKINDDGDEVIDCKNGVKFIFDAAVRKKLKEYNKDKNMKFVFCIDNSLPGKTYKLVYDEGEEKFKFVLQD